jgi:DNA replication protein DnaC|tara:strand:- start:114 stop:884 length:771 start_codon:yes stop_codon:yes gene_type:complete
MKNPMPELTPLLTKLKLSGISEVLARRNKEAIDNKLSYMEFFGLLLQDEILRRENKQFAKRIKQSGFRGDKTIENFDFSFNPKLDQQLIKDLATCRFLHEKASVLIVGPCGTGKSHLAQALGHSTIKQQGNVIMTNQGSISQELLSAQAIGNYQRAIKKFTKADLLIIDDFGLKPLKGNEDEYLHEIIAERYEEKSTIVTSNLDVIEWQDAFPNKLLGAATIDRIQHGAYHLVLDGESYRSLNKQKSAPKSAKIDH